MKVYGIARHDPGGHFGTNNMTHISGTTIGVTAMKTGKCLAGMDNYNGIRAMNANGHDRPFCQK